MYMATIYIGIIHNVGTNAHSIMIDNIIFAD